MLVHYTLIKVMPERVPQAAELLAGSRLIEYFLKAHGLRHGSLSECVDEPGKLFSLSMWDSLADAHAVFADPNYSVLISEIRSLLIAAPVRIGYNLLETQVNRPLVTNQALFIHNTILTVAPENTPRLLSTLYSPKTIALSAAFPGFYMSYAFEALEAPGQIISMSWWDSVADAQATFAHPEYAALLDDLQAYLIRPPERQGYKLLKIVRHK